MAALRIDDHNRLADVNISPRAVGVPAGGLTFADRCKGGLMGHCMRSPFMPGQLPAIAAPFWDALIAQFAPETLRPFLLGPGSQPGDPALGTVFRRLNTDALGPRGRRGVPARSGVPATCPRWYRRCSTASKRGTRD